MKNKLLNADCLCGDAGSKLSHKKADSASVGAVRTGGSFNRSAKQSHEPGGGGGEGSPASPQLKRKLS